MSRPARPRSAVFKTIEKADRLFSMMQSLFDWCQDYQMELKDLARGDEKYNRDLLDYTKEFYSIYSQTEGLILFNNRIARAEAYAKLSEYDNFIQVYNNMRNLFREEIWLYTRFGDILEEIAIKQRKSKLLEKAKNFYKKAIKLSKKQGNKYLLKVARRRIGDLEKYLSQ